MNRRATSKKSVVAEKKRKTLVELWKSNPRSFFIVSSALVALSYIKPIFSVWAYSDEYDYFETFPKLGTHMARDGNLISSLLYNNFSAPLINTAGDLWRLRILSFLCLILILNHVSKQILIHNQSLSVQFLLPIALTLPAPMTFISWALIWQGSFAMLVGYVASVFWLKSKFGLKLISAILLWSSILMSPVAAFSIFGFYASIFILARLKTVDFVKVTLKLVSLYGISGIAALLTIFINTKINGLSLNGRVGPPELNDLPEKVYWIISRPIMVSMRFFDISSPSQINAVVVSLLVLSILICGLANQSRSLSESITFRLILFSTLILLSITPIMISWSNQIEFRYILGPSIAIFLTTAVLTFEIIGRQKNSLRYAFLPVILLISFIGITSVNYHVSNQFIKPYKSKIDFIKSELSNCQKENRSFEKVIVQQPKTSYPSRNNIGIFSQSSDMASLWVPIPSVKYVLKTFYIFPREITLQDSVDESGLNFCIFNLEEYSQQLAVSENSIP
jgi:hypothetical protein